MEKFSAANESPAVGVGPSTPAVHGRFQESHVVLPRDELLKRRIGDLKLQLDSAPIGRLSRRLYDEMKGAGLVQFRPPVYLSDDWGCPDRVPIIGVPFYMANEELTRLADELLDGVDAASDDEIMNYLRHEAGHALNYAYRLYDLDEWNTVFGPFLRPYSDDYTPNPFSRSFVRHLPAWYAQKHPDEDFAETFAVWLDPKSNWRYVYAGWPCLAKLHYVDRLVKEIGPQPPPVTADNYDTQEEYLKNTIGEHYRQVHQAPVEIPHAFDAALRDVFPPEAATGDTVRTAAEFLQEHRRVIIGSVFYWTGLNEQLVRALVDHFEQRSAALELKVGDDWPDRLIEIVTLVSTLCMNRLRTGEFVQK